MSDKLSASPFAREAWDALGGEAGELDRVTLYGSRAGLLPSRLPVLDVMVAAVGVSTLAVSELDAARRGCADSSPVSVDVEHVAVATRSERFARRSDSDLQASMAPLSRFWKAADGWVRLHTNYPWHLERALGVLGCDAEPREVAAAIAARSTTEIEESFARAGALAFAVRDVRAWSRHPQGRAVSRRPLVKKMARTGGTVHRVGPGRALEGIRVLDLTRVIAGPVATRTLAAWGADVLRVDPPGLPEIPAQTIDTLQGKRSTLLDLATPDAYARLDELLAEAHVVVQGYRPGALAELGLDASSLAARWPHLSLVTISAWGDDGPWAERRGFDSLVQCPTGIATIEGDREAPGALPAQALDHATGYLAAAAATLALAGSLADGSPRSHEVSLARTAKWLTDGGVVEKQPARELDAARYLRSVGGDGFDVDVVAAPGLLADLRPGWTRAAGWGADAPRFNEPRDDEDRT